MDTRHAVRTVVLSITHDHPLPETCALIKRTRSLEGAEPLLVNKLLGLEQSPTGVVELILTLLGCALESLHHVLEL